MCFVEGNSGVDILLRKRRLQCLRHLQYYRKQGSKVWFSNRCMWSRVLPSNIKVVLSSNNYKHIASKKKKKLTSTYCIIRIQPSWKYFHSTRLTVECELKMPLNFQDTSNGNSNADTLYINMQLTQFEWIKTKNLYFGLVIVPFFVNPL